MQNINYLIFTNYLKAFSDAHMQVKRYKSDFVDQLQNFGSGGVTYPLLYCAPSNYTFTPNKFTGSRLNTLSVNVYCIDLLLDDRSNVTPILNTTSCVLNDLFKWLTEGGLPGIDLLSVSPLRPLNNYTMESCAGWVMTVNVQLESYGVCDIPFAYEPILIPDGPTPPDPGPGPTPPGGCSWDGVNPYAVTYGMEDVGYPQAVPVSGSWVPLLGFTDILTCNGEWGTNVLPRNENRIHYLANTPRVFLVSVNIKCSTPNAATVEYSSYKSQGNNGQAGIFDYTPRGSGYTPGNSLPQISMTRFTLPWRPSTTNDFFSLTTRVDPFTEQNSLDIFAVSVQEVTLGPNSGDWRVNYELPTPSTPFNTLFVGTYQPIPGTPNIVSSVGSWLADGTFGNLGDGNVIIYQGSEARSFTVTVTVAVSTETVPQAIYYSYFKEEGGVPTNGTPQGGPATFGNDIPHQLFSYTVVWTPSQVGDRFSATITQGDSPQQTLTLRTFNVTIE